MKVLIVCFSQTGNTRKVAEKIRDGIIKEIGSCDLVSLRDADVNGLAGYDLVGLGTPVFYYKEPFNVRDFMEGLPELNGKQWFVFCSHGSVMGQTLISMKECLEKKGIKVIGSHHTYSDGTIPFYPYPTVTTGHPDDREFEEAFEFGSSIVKCSRAVSRGDMSCVEDPKPVPEEWIAPEAEMLNLDFMKQVMPRLSINTDTCAECGDCVDACPVDGIDIEADPPRIQEPCIYCWNCAKICPTCSIEADWSGLVSMAPQNYDRYIKSLKEAEARGEFRWLVDPESMNYEDPLYKQREREIKK